LATKTLGAAGVDVATGLGVGSGVAVELGVAETVAAGLVDGTDPAVLGVPQAASNTGAMRASSTFLVIAGYLDLERGRKGAGDVPPSAGWETVAAICMFT
jgi:hypothetical protein